MTRWQEISTRVEKNLVDRIEDIYAAHDAAAISVSAAQTTEEIFDLLDNEFRLWRHVEVVGLFDAQQDVSTILLALSIVEGVAQKNIECREIEDQDWVSRWQHQQKPLDFGHGLVICPPSLAASVPSSRQILLEPGMAFGTGTHPTTKMCLQWIAARNWSQQETALDLGCGSGVLAMAMSKCGAGRVHACDIDPQALVVAEANVRKNAITNIDIALNADLSLEKADVVVANILLEPLIAEKSLIEKTMAAGAELVMTGILADQAETLVAAFEAEFALKIVSTEQDWALVAGRKRGKT